MHRFEVGEAADFGEEMVRYEHEVGPGVLAAGLDWSWRAQPPLNAFNLDSRFPEALIKKYNPAIGLLSGRLEYNIPDKGLSVGLFATNLLNTTYQVESEFIGGLGLGTAITQEPRMFGVTIKKTFGTGE